MLGQYLTFIFVILYYFMKDFFEFLIGAIALEDFFYASNIMSEEFATRLIYEYGLPLNRVLLQKIFFKFFSLAPTS